MIGIPPFPAHEKTALCLDRAVNSVGWQSIFSCFYMYPFVNRRKAKEIKNLQDKVLPHLKQQLADTKGLFKGKERKALEVKIKETEVEIADRLDKIPDTLKADGYPDVQVFMRTFREMESVVEQYNRDLAEWEYQVSRKPTAATKEQHRPPERQSVLKHLREIQERNKQQPPQRQYKKSIDRDSR